MSGAHWIHGGVNDGDTLTPICSICGMSFVGPYMQEHEAKCWQAKQSGKGKVDAIIDGVAELLKGPSGIERLVCDDIAGRQKAGIEKYGTTVEDNPLREDEWLQHAYEEALDLAVYLKRLIVMKRPEIDRLSCKICGGRRSVCPDRVCQGCKLVSIYG